MHIYYLIGASGVGKSAICNEVKQTHPYIETKELDEVYRKYIQYGRQLAIDKTRELLQEIEALNVDKIYLIDVGSFAQKYLENSYWDIRKNSLICLIIDAGSCFDNYKIRHKGGGMSLSSFMKSEFNDKRKELYLLARYHINITNLDVSTTKQKVFEIINQATLGNTSSKE